MNECFKHDPGSVLSMLWGLQKIRSYRRKVFSSTNSSIWNHSGDAFVLGGESLTDFVLSLPSTPNLWCIQIHRIGSAIYYYLHSWAAVSEDYHKISIQWLMHHAVSEMQPTFVDRTRSSLNWLYGVLGLAPPNPARTKGSTTKRYWTK